jgi:4'-phosphopantetheinyl transferase
MASVVHLWPWRLAVSPARLARLWEVLAPAERERADRFRFERHRNAFVAARGTLRELIGNYIDCLPQTVEFAYNSHGKPSVKGICFNLSHSAEFALAAFSRDFELGVDVEGVDRNVDLQVARRFFSPTEVESLFALPEAERPEGFLRIWTRKEAVIKAFGKGLALPLAGFDVTVRREGARLLRCDWEPGAPDTWSLRDVSKPGEYIAAMAAPVREFELVKREIAENDGTTGSGSRRQV